jgi:uncharacterized protein with FMN-binding domain
MHEVVPAAGARTSCPLSPCEVAGQGGISRLASLGRAKRARTPALQRLHAYALRPESVVSFLLDPQGGRPTCWRVNSWCTLGAGPSRTGGVLSFFAPLLLCANLLAGEGANAGLEGRLRAEFVPPDWLAATAVPFPDEELTATNQFGLTIWTKVFACEADPAKFQQAVATVHRVLKLNSRPAFQAVCCQMLGYYYEGMFEDYVRAFQWYRQLDQMSGQARQVHDPQNHNMRDAKRLAALGMARCYAKVGAVAEAEALLKEHRFQDWRELFDLAATYQSLKDLKRSDAAVAAGIAAGRQSIWDQVSAAGRGLVLFYANGNLEQVKRHLPPYQKLHQTLLNQERGKKLPDHIVALDAMIGVIVQELDKADAVSLNLLRDGVFAGENPGFNQPIGVSVTVQGGKLEAIKITRMEEKRCFNAAQFIPAQILKQGSLKVDGVTGATVTCLAIENAVREALRKAQK